MEVVEDLLGMLKVFKDGSVFRVDSRSPLFFTEASKKREGEVFSKDVVLNSRVGLWVRIFLPPIHKTPMPLIVYFPGGGFCLGSPAVPDFHNFSSKMAESVGAMIVSVNYRLAPEHRLPAAYDDCIAALEWVRRHAVKDKNDGAAEFEPETWVETHADFSRVYLLGDSAGANIIHQVMLRKEKEWKPTGLEMKGAIMLQPFFGGEERKPSEANCPKDAFLNLELNDGYWRLALPEGCDRDHPFCNPWSGELGWVKDVGFPPLLVAIGGRDLLRDRGLEYCEWLKNMGKEVEMIVWEEEEHGFYALKLNSANVELLMRHICQFVNQR